MQLFSNSKQHFNSSLELFVIHLKYQEVKVWSYMSMWVLAQFLKILYRYCKHQVIKWCVPGERQESDVLYWQRRGYDETGWGNAVPTGDQAQRTWSSVWKCRPVAVLCLCGPKSGDWTKSSLSHTLGRKNSGTVEVVQLTVLKRY